MEINYSNEINNFEKEFLNTGTLSNISILKETFIVWYCLVEGETEFNEAYLQEILVRNINIIERCYPNNPELIFLQGWMKQISSWFFDSDENDYGEKNLFLAYRYCPENVLYKWALREKLHLSIEELKNIKIALQNNFEEYYVSYLPIKEYFIGIICS